MINLQPGQMLGPYRIIEQIGQGGMASVHKAYHAAMDRYVAIKILPYQFKQNREFIQRFQREVRVIAKLEHPHILPVYDSGESEGIPYLVMRYMATGTLKEHIETRPHTLANIDKLVTQFANALGYAHSHGVIHRDVKPSNALIDKRGDIYLTDFGIAKLTEDTAKITQSGAITGTPAYMSPEQAQGEHLDPRSDIYSLGIVLYEMVTGRVPYEAETPLAVILKHIQAPLPPPTTVKEDLHPAIEQVLLKALAKNREDRFENTEEFIAAWKKAVTLVETGAPTQQIQGLQDITAPTPPPPTIASAPAAQPAPAVSPAPTMPAQAKTPGPSAPASPPASRRKFPWLWAGGGALVILAIIAGIFIFSNLSNSTGDGDIRDTTTSAEQPAAPGEGTATSWTAANRVYSLEWYGDYLLAGGPSGITVWDLSDESFSSITIGDGLPDETVWDMYNDGDGNLWVGTDNGLGFYDGETWTIFNTLDGLDSEVITAIAEIDNKIVVGTAYGSEGGGLNLYDGQFWARLPFDSAEDEDPDRFSNRVSALLVTEDNQLWVGTENGLGFYDGSGWTRYTTEDGLPDNRIYSLSFDRDGNVLIGTASGAALFDWETFMIFENMLESSINGIVQDGNGRYWFSGGGGIWMFNPGNGDWQEFSPYTGEIPSWSLNGALMDYNDGSLYFASNDHGIIVFDGGFRTIEAANTPSLAAHWNILQAPDGTLWFLEEYGGGIDVYDPKNDEWYPHEGLPCCLIPLAFDEKGTLWGGGSTGLWNDQTNLTTTHGLPSDQVRSLTFHPDGAVWIATEEGIAILENSTVIETFSSEEAGLPSDYVFRVFAASDGAVWVGHGEGVSRRLPNGEWEHFGIDNPFSGGFYRAYAFAEDQDGGIWIGTWGAGAYYWFENEWTRYYPGERGVGLPSVDIGTILPVNGGVWFGSEDGSAFFDGESWEQFGVEDGLIHPRINSIFVDNTGTLWFTTGGGVTRYVP